jgi:hypothetical protein
MSDRAEYNEILKRHGITVRCCQCSQERPYFEGPGLHECPHCGCKICLYGDEPNEALILSMLDMFWCHGKDWRLHDGFVAVGPRPSVSE